MIIAVSGASGFIGSYLIKRFSTIASEILILNRNGNDIQWKEALLKADVIFNLAGSPINKRWNKKNRKEILESRILTTQRIVTLLNELPETINKKLLISASATGIYPDDKFTLFNELSNEKGSGFLSEVVSKWEAEADNLINPSIRLVIVRFGIVIGKKGGFLNTIIPFYKLGLGGVLGSGKQLTCFIHIEDIFNAFIFFINNQNTSGLYNLVSPNPVTAKEFTKIVAHKLHRPAIFKIPSFFIKLVFGQASCIMLNGANVYPHQLINQGFKFSYSTLEDAIDEVLS